MTGMLSRPRRKSPAKAGKIILKARSPVAPNSTSASAALTLPPKRAHGSHDRSCKFPSGLGRPVVQAECLEGNARSAEPVGQACPLHPRPSSKVFIGAELGALAQLGSRRRRASHHVE